jgi:Nitrate reductase delta subunit.
MMQDARDEVLKAYRAEGTALIDGYVMPEDHLGIELEFMATLCQRQADAYEEGDQAEAERLEQVQADFFARHIDAWVPELIVDFTRLAKTSYYRDVAAMLSGLLSFERDRFSRQA